jgi:Fe-S cluster biosynthesis and repair protein YggX
MDQKYKKMEKELNLKDMEESQIIASKLDKFVQEGQANEDEGKNLN